MKNPHLAEIEEDDDAEPHFSPSHMQAQIQVQLDPHQRLARGQLDGPQ